MTRDFGAFELREKIGSGGMAQVYLGVQKSLGRPVVLKILYPHLAEDEKLVARFEREARAAAILRHENIVQIIDYGRFEDVSYIAMEFVGGLDLKKWLETHGHPPYEMALLMLRDVCHGLEQAHAQGIVHRDIKPANLMLTPDGVVKIMDFGLARRGEDATSVTVEGAVLGTPAYMSPEQATGERVDERTDIFSLGVIGYELLGGRRPFAGDTYSSVLHAILAVDPPSIAELNPLLPEEVVTIIHRMLQKDVSRRVSSIRSVRAELETVVEAQGLHRGRDLLRDFVEDPGAVSVALRRKRLARHLDQGLYFENLGLGRIDDALREFRRVLHLDPVNSVALAHVRKLERERSQVPPGAGSPADATMVLGPGAVESPRPAPAAPARAPDRRAAPAPPAAPQGRDRDRRRIDQARWGLVAASAALVVLVLVGVFAITRPPAERPGAASAPADRPTSGPPLADAAASTAEPLPPPASASTPVAPKPRPPVAPAARASSAGAPSTAVTAPAGGTLVIRAVPYATYRVDGKVAAANLAMARIPVEAGTHTVVVEHPQLGNHEWRQVVVKGGANVELTHDFLAEAKGRLNVGSGDVWARIWLDGQDTGKSTPASIEVAHGEHTLELRREGFTVEGGQRTVVVKPGETVTATFALKPGP